MAFNKSLAHKTRVIAREQGIVVAGIGLAAFYWLIESLIMTVMFKEHGIMYQLFTPEAHEVWSRFLVISIIIAFSVVNQSIFNKNSRTEKNLKELSGHLEQLVKQRTEELAETNNRLREKIDQKANFARTIVHELKTPLTPMIGASEMLMERTKDDRVLSRLAKNINSGAQNLNRRISDLTDLAKGETGILSIKYKPFDLLQTIRDLAEYEKIYAERKKLSIVLDLPPSFPAVWADEDRVRQVVLNLLDNAIKFTPQCGKITIKIDAIQDNVMVHVKDNGYGIDAAEQEHLFEPYWTDKDSRSSPGGQGIGLPLSKMIIELQGGQMWVESKKGAGSTFSFSIPMILPKSSDSNV